MGQKDLQEKILLSHNDVFADVANLFLGKKIIKADELKDSQTESVYKIQTGDLASQSRDVSKCWGSGKTILATLAIENQTAMDERMPLRIIGYDGATYRSQYDKKELYPVITIVLNFSDEKWKDKYKSLSGIIDVPDEIKAYFSDYTIHVIDVAFLSEELRQQLTSDFKVISNFFYNKRIGKESNIFNDRTALKHPLEVVDFFKIFTKDDRFDKIKEDVLGLIEKGDTVTMCSVCDILEERGIEQGIEQGIERAYFELLQKGKITVEDVAEELGISVQEVEEKMFVKRYNMSVTQ